MINSKRLLRLAQDVIRINSENPPGREAEIASYISTRLKKLKITTKSYEFVKGRPNILATLPGQMPRKQARAGSLLITPHIDTVPIGSGWKEDPLGGRIKNGRIYGRGASDDKGNLACCLEVLHSLVEDGIPFKRDLIMAATADEETGSRYGIIPLLERKVLKPGYAFILDSDDYNTIITQKGLIHCRVQVIGRRAHGAYVWRGINAIELSAKIIREVKAHRFRYQPHPLLREPTVNVGVIKGGDKVNMVADSCEFALDIRFLPGMDPTKVLRDLRQIILRTTRRYKIIIDDLQQPYTISSDNPFVSTYVAAAKALGIKARLQGSEGATVITFFKQHGIPAFASGFGAHGTAHTTDEFAKVASLIQGARLLENFIKRFDDRG